MRIVFMGTPKFSVPALERLISSEHEIVAVYTQPDKSAGRGRKLTPPPVKVLAANHNLRIAQPGNLRDSAEVERLAALSPDIIIVVAFGQILPRPVLDIPDFGCLNIHPSLLPKYRGASPVASAILAGEEETGVTIMLLDAGMDTGPVLVQKRALIDSQDTTESLEGKLAVIGADLLVETLAGWLGHRLVPQPQKDEDATYTKPISKSDGQIDWNLPATELARKVRAFHPWPGCYTRWQGEILRLLEAIAIRSDGVVEPGRVVPLSAEPKTVVGVGTGEGILGLRLVQREGKKAVSIIDFLRGQREFIGQKLG